MKKYIGGLFALLTSLTMVSAYAAEGCCGGCGKGKVMASAANTAAPVVSKTAPATPAATTPSSAAVAKAPVIAKEDAKKALAPQENVSEDDSEDDE